jgi:hypothetical protein
MQHNDYSTRRVLCCYSVSLLLLLLLLLSYCTAIAAVHMQLQVCLALIEACLSDMKQQSGALLPLHIAVCASINADNKQAM